jgi:hypothetical protein
MSQKHKNFDLLKKTFVELQGTRASDGIFCGYSWDRKKSPGSTNSDPGIFLYLNKIIYPSVSVPKGMKGSLMATTVAPLASAARSTRRPIRPNPLMPMSAISSEIHKISMPL